MRGEHRPAYGGWSGAGKALVGRRRRGGASAAAAVAMGALLAAVVATVGLEAAGTKQEADRRALADPVFDHERHESVSCRECHGTGDRHGATLVRTVQDCLACHHDERRAYGCETCHRAAELPAGPVRVPMPLSVWDEPRPRDLPFDHEEHGGIACQECHRAPVTLAAERRCDACHTDHHRPEAACAQCHRPSEPEPHRLGGHLNCAECHAPRSPGRFSLSRELCVMCHTAQRDHEPQGLCQACHMIPELPPAIPDPPAPVDYWPARTDTVVAGRRGTD